MLQLADLNLQNASWRQYHGAFDEVLELSYVSRPRITTKRFHRLFRNRLNPLVHALRIFVHVMAHQKRYVPRPLPQRWNPDRKNVQPKIEILAKLFVPDHLFQIPVRRGHHPHIHALRACASPDAQIPVPATPATAWAAAPTECLPLRREIAFPRGPAQSARSVCATAPVKAPFS